MTEHQPVSFDTYTKTYSDEVNQAVHFSGRRHEFFLDAKVDVFSDLIGRAVPLSDTRVLDVGCGVGAMASKLAPQVECLVGVEIAGAALREALHRVPAAALCHYDGRRLPFAESSFDAVFTSCVLHHVPPAQWPRFVREMVRVTAPGGVVLIFEHNPWNPLTRLAVRQCEFDRDAVLLRAREVRQLLRNSGARVAALRYFLLTPWRARPWRLLERLVEKLPFGAQYAVLGKVEKS